MYLLVLILPLLSFVVSLMTGYLWGRKLTCLLSVSLLVMSFCVSAFIFFEVNILGIVTVTPLFKWFVIDIFSVTFGLLFDHLTATMLVVITFISCLVHLYSTEYMENDPFLNRFLGYLSLFTFFMIFLVTSDNFIQLFIGWEGVGLCSYLLINFWFTRVLANKAALKAMIMNRIADVFFVIAIFLLLIFFGTTDFMALSALIATTSNNYYIGWWNVELITIVCFFFIFGAIGKSAQLGFHTWLPDAMEGPTPVSSLLHAATMVTAGVFLIIRCSNFFEHASQLLTIIAIFGGLTAFFSAFVAVFQWDLKKVIAYSTCSQLGYMFLACGFSYYSVALFHLFNHAFFKALLFLSAGSVIHALNDEQDMRRMGGLLRFLPFTFVCILFGSLAIMGFPFLTGFYSKDLILELLLSSYLIDSLFFYNLALAAAFLTAFYSIRLLIYVFFLPANFTRSHQPHEPHWAMTVSLLFLVLASIIFGFIFSDLFIGPGSLYNSNTQLYVSLLSPFDRNLPLIVSLCASLSAFGLTTSHYLYNKYIYYIYSRASVFFYYAGHFNTIYNKIFTMLFIVSYNTNTKLFDKGLLEAIGPVGFYRIFSFLSKRIRQVPSVLYLNIGYMFYSIIFIYIFALGYPLISLLMVLIFLELCFPFKEEN